MIEGTDGTQVYIYTAPGMQAFIFFVRTPEGPIQLHVNTYLDAGKSLEPFSPNLIGKLIRLSGSCTTGDRKKGLGNQQGYYLNHLYIYIYIYIYRYIKEALVGSQRLNGYGWGKKEIPCLRYSLLPREILA